MPQGSPRPRVMRIARKAAAAAIVRGGLVRLLGGNFLPTLGNIVLAGKAARTSSSWQIQSSRGRREGTGEGKKMKSPGICLGFFISREPKMAASHGYAIR
jgi:hypothetical protein